MSGGFKQLEVPERYYNSNGVSFGYVVRVVGLSRTTYLNYLCGMQQDLVVVDTGGYGVINAIFKTIEEAHETAYKYYTAYHEEYDFKQNICGNWYYCGIAKNHLKTVESQVMEFV